MSLDILRDQLETPRGRTIAAGVGAAVLTGAVVLVATSGKEQPLLAADDLQEVCEDAELNVDDRSGEAFTGPLNQSYASFKTRLDEGHTLEGLANTYYPYAPYLGAASLIAANPGIPVAGELPEDTVLTLHLSNLDRQVLPPGTELEDYAEQKDLPVLTVQCLNGLHEEAAFEEPVRIVVPLQSSGDKVLATHVVQAGEGYELLAGDTPPIVGEKAIPGDRLQPGDILYFGNEEKTRFIQPQEAIAEHAALTDFYNTYAGIAYTIEREDGIPHELLLGQAFHESFKPSTGGLSELATVHNNFFGVKASETWDGKVGMYETWEVAPDDAALAAYKDDKDKPEKYKEDTPRPTGGYDVKVIAPFRSYDTPQEGLQAQAELFKRVYPEALEHDDPYAFLHAMVDDEGPKYATDPRYAESVSRMIDQVKLLEANVVPSAYSAALSQNK